MSLTGLIVMVGFAEDSVSRESDARQLKKWSSSMKELLLKRGCAHHLHVNSFPHPKNAFSCILDVICLLSGLEQL